MQVRSKAIGSVLAGPSLGHPREQVVGVQHGGLGGLGQTVAAEAEDVGVGADEDAEVALEAAQAADRALVVAPSSKRGPAPFSDSIRSIRGTGRNGSIRSETAIGPAPGPPPPCGWLNDLWRLTWTMSKPMSPGPDLAHDRVQVGAVVVERPAGLVDDPGDLGDVLVEEPERVRVGQHQAGDLVGRLRAQVVEVDPAALVAGDLDHLVAGHRHRRRVGPVGGVGSENLGALLALAAVGVVGAGQQQAGELAVGAGRGLQADVRQAADLAQRPLEPPHQLERALGAGRVGAPGCRRAWPGSAATRSLRRGLCFIVHEPSG